jgi:hypothetical protein
MRAVGSEGRGIGTNSSEHGQRELPEISHWAVFDVIVNGCPYMKGKASPAAA